MCILHKYTAVCRNCRRHFVWYWVWLQCRPYINNPIGHTWSTTTCPDRTRRWNASNHTWLSVQCEDCDIAAEFVKLTSGCSCYRVWRFELWANIEAANDPPPPPPTAQMGNL